SISYKSTGYQYTRMPPDGKDGDLAPLAVRWIEVSEDEAGQRIDNYLIARLKGVPKSRIYRIVRSGEVRINSKRVEASDRVAAAGALPGAGPPARPGHLRRAACGQEALGPHRHARAHA